MKEGRRQTVCIETDSQDKLEIIMKSIIENTRLTASLSYLDNTLSREDYIIFFYAKEFASRGVDRLTERGLGLALENNAIYWIKKNSRINVRTSKESKKLSAEYLTTKAGRSLLTEADCAQTLKELVLQRFRECCSANTPNTESETQAIIEGHKISTQIKFAEDITLRCYDLMSGDKSCDYIDNIRYEQSDILAFIRDLASNYLSQLNDSHITNSNEAYQHYLKSLSSSVSATQPVFKWNLGQAILSNPLKGWMITVNAPKKKGKTRFVLGEMVYAALKAGRNVDYLSGEMKIVSITALLIVKYLYAEHNMDFSNGTLFRNIEIALQISAKIQLGIECSPSEMKALERMGRDFFTLIVYAQNELKGPNSKFGQLKVVSLEEDEREKGGMNGFFTIETLESSLIDSIEKRDPEFRPDMVVFDHAGHFVSTGKLTQTECFRKVYQLGHKMAGNKANPFLCVVINHTATEQEENVYKNTKKNSNTNVFDGMDFRAFGTSEAGKSADLDISLMSTDDQDKDGQITLIVNVDRWTDVKSSFRTNAFPMNARKGNCDFTILNSVKKEYPLKEDIELGEL